MPTIDIVKKINISDSIRCQQIQSMFDIPLQSEQALKWNINLPIENNNWNVGLIVGPSGSGKTIITKYLFSDNFEPDFEWTAKSVIDDFDNKLSIAEITAVCQAVGFNTIPAWLRPYHVLSNGEQFRVDIARRLLELDDPIIKDEFTSVVDRQVAKIGSHSISKYIRRNKKKFVAVSCHYDIIDWLQPDWILDMATMEYQPRGNLQQRPKIEATVKKVPNKTWSIFSKYHYLTASLHPLAKCFAIHVNDKPVCFCATLHQPNKVVKNLKRMSRSVTLPDWQGLGLVFILNDIIGSAYKTIGYRIRIPSAHPQYTRSLMKSKTWKLVKKQGFSRQKSSVGRDKKTGGCSFIGSPRPIAIFEYNGPKIDIDIAHKLLDL